MGETFSPLHKLICLSALLAAGFLLVILACALYNNYYPLLDVLVFVLAPLPNAVFGGSSFGGNEFMNERVQSAQEFGQFMTGGLVASGLILPVVFYHTGLINQQSCIASVIGGGIIYLCIIIFSWFFNRSWEEDEDALFSY